MKKITILLAIVAMAVTASAQAKKDTVKAVKPRGEYFVKVSPADFQTLTQMLNEYSSAIKWHQLMSAEEKIKAQQNIEYYLKQLSSRVKLDSVVKK